MAATTAPVLTTDAVTVTTDRMGRLYAVIPDDVARPLTVAARKGIAPEAHGSPCMGVTPADDLQVQTERRLNAPGQWGGPHSTRHQRPPDAPRPGRNG